MRDLNKNLSKKKVIIFDLDGTIIKLNVNWNKLKQILVDRFYSVYGQKKEFKTITECFNEIVARNDDSELNNLFALVRDYELKNIENLELIEETIYFINHLDQFGLNDQVFLAILSLNMKKTIKKSLKLAGLDNLFHFIVGKENVRKWKPDPSGLFKIKDHFGVNNEDMIYFGDLKKDVETGMNAGIDAYLIDKLIMLVKDKARLSLNS